MTSIRTSCFMTLAVMFVACSNQQDENTSTAASAQYETLRRDVATMLSEEPDSVFNVLDSLKAAGQYPECVINLIRGNMYGQMMSLRFAEFYLRKAIGEELHEVWPRGYYMGIYNLGLSLQERSNLEEALKVSKAGYEEVVQETDPSLKIWETSLQYVIGGCQLMLKQLDEGDKTMQRCYNQLMERAATDTTHTSMEQIGTMSTNIALDYYNHYPSFDGLDNEQGMFVTMFICRLNLKLNLFEYCNAGHNPPVLGNDDGQFSFLDMEPNAPIGLWSGLEYVGESIDFFKNRLLFLYTDGLNEAEDTEQNQFGEERLLNVLRQTNFDSARQVIEVMTQEVEQHRKGAEPNDDLTMLCLRID